MPNPLTNTVAGSGNEDISGVVDSLPEPYARSYHKIILIARLPVDAVVSVVDAIVSSAAAIPTTATPGHGGLALLEREMDSSGLLSIADIATLRTSISSRNNNKPQGQEYWQQLATIGLRPGRRGSGDEKYGDSKQEEWYPPYHCTHILAYPTRQGCTGSFLTSPEDHFICFAVSGHYPWWICWSLASHLCSDRRGAHTSQISTTPPRHCYPTIPTCRTSDHRSRFVNRPKFRASITTTPK